MAIGISNGFSTGVDMRRDDVMVDFSPLVDCESDVSRTPRRRPAFSPWSTGCERSKTCRRPLRRQSFYTETAEL
jgi:hypothetical protein